MYLYRMSCCRNPFLPLPFYRPPKVLFTDPKFRSILSESKILYGLLLDRMSLFIKSG